MGKNSNSLINLLWFSKDNDITNMFKSQKTDCLDCENVVSDINATLMNTALRWNEQQS